MNRAWIPLPTAARHLGVPLSRAIALIRSGRLRARLVAGRRWFVDNTSLKALQVEGRAELRGSKTSDKQSLAITQA